MSKNIRKILEQFSDEGLEDEWHEIYNQAITELDSLEEKARELAALKRAGVDNWEGLDYAMQDFRDFPVDKQL